MVVDRESWEFIRETVDVIKRVVIVLRTALDECSQADIMAREVVATYEATAPGRARRECLDGRLAVWLGRREVHEHYIMLDYIRLALELKWYML